MIAYVLLYSFSLFSSLLTFLHIKKKQIFFIGYVVILYFVFFSSFHSLSGDKRKYYQIFRSIRSVVLPIYNDDSYDVNKRIDPLSINASIDIDPIYIYINKFFALIKAPFTLMLLAIALLSTGLKFKAFNNLSPYPVFSLFIYLTTYYIMMDMSGIRQGLAISLSMFSLMYLLRDKKSMFFILLISDFFIHSSCIIVFIAYFVKYFKLRVYILSLLISLFTFLFLDLSSVFIFFANLFPDTSIIHNKMMSYINSKFILSFSPIYLVYFLQVFFFYYYSTVIKSDVYCFLCKLYILGVALYFLFAPLSLDRGAYYFLILDTILIPLVIFHSRYTFNRIVYFLAFITYLTLRYYFFLLYDRVDMIPYQFSIAL